MIVELKEYFQVEQPSVENSLYPGDPTDMGYKFVGALDFEGLGDRYTESVPFIRFLLDGDDEFFESPDEEWVVVTSGNDTVLLLFQTGNYLRFGVTNRHSADRYITYLRSVGRAK